MEKYLLIFLIFVWCAVSESQSYATGYATTKTNDISTHIILREEWNATQPKLKQNLTERPVPFVVVHHSATRSCTTEESCKKLVKSFQTYHMNTKNWDDIAYNFVIGEDGNVYEGRGWGVKGSHATIYNGISIGICITGTFTDHTPNEKAMSALAEIINYGVKTEEIQSDYKLIGHQQVNPTECPGKSLFAELQTWSHWSPNNQTIDSRSKFS